MTSVQKINEQIANGTIITTPIWKGVYTPESRYQVVEAVGHRTVKVQLQNAEEDAWTKTITVDFTDWQVIEMQAYNA